MVMNQHIVSRIAIYLLAIALFAFGIEHFTHPHDLIIKVPDFLPGGMVWVYGVGVAFMLAAISFVTNIWVRTAAYLLAILLFAFVFTVHLPQYLETADKTYQQMAFTNMLKDAALAAFALYIASNARHQRILEDTEVKEESRERQTELVPQ
jgi:putative oxidoreductase